MYKRFKKIAAIILTICMVLSMAPAVYAESEGPVMTQVDFLIYDVYGLDATILSSGAGSVDHLSYVVGDNEPVNVYDGAINKQFDEALSVKVTVFVEFGADVTDGSAHNVSLQYRVLSDNGEWSEQQFDSKTVYCPAHGVPEQPEPEPTGQPDDPEPAESPAPTDPPGDDGGDNGSIVNPGEGGNEGGETEQPGNPSIVIGEPSDEDPFNPPPSGEEGGGGAPAPGFWVYSPPNSDEIDLFYVSPNVRDLVNIDTTLVDIARKELAAEDSREERYKTDVVKYNNWFYDVDDAESVSDYDGELTEHNWNAVFVTWCAEQLCYVDFNRFPMTNDATEMFEWLCNVDENNVLTLGEALSTMTEYDIQEGDIVFIPEEDGYNVGIVSAFDKETRTASFIFGDHNKAVEEEEFDLFSLPSTTTFVHIYVPDAQLAAIASFLIRELDIKPSAAAGILANIRWESGFNPTALGDGGTSYGLCQWHMGRWDNLVEYCNGQDVSWTTMLDVDERQTTTPQFKRWLGG